MGNINKKGKVLSDEQRKRISVACKGRIISEKQREQISLRHKGKIVSEETKAKISEALKGKHLSEEVKAKISETLKGRSLPEETKAKMKEARKYSWTPEVKDKISMKLSGEGNPSWLGGASFIPYSSEWTKKLKNFILDRDNHECQNPYCKHISKKVQVHHIDYDKKNCSEFNLITLCISCHTKSNFNRRLWKVFYNKVVCSKYLYKEASGY